MNGAPLKFWVVRLMSLAFMVSFFLTNSIYAAQRFVRPGGAGANNGSDWNNAWNGLSGIQWSSINCGDTIWVAGGTYNQDLYPSKSCTSSSPLAIRRARADALEATSAPGWNSSFDATVLQYRSSIIFGSYNNILISGRTKAAGGDYGWLIHFPGVTQGIGIEWPNGSTGSDITVEYMEIRGPDILGFTGDGRGIDDTPFSSAKNHTFSHLKILGWESGIYVGGTDNHVSEFIDMSNIKSDGLQHPNLYYIIGSNNGIIRNSKFHDTAASGTGIAFSDGGPWNNWLIQGNLFYNNTDAYAAAIGIQDAPIVGLKIYNNTFVNNAMNLNIGSAPAACGSGSETKNNLFYGAGGAFSCGITSNNLAITSSPDPFINRNMNDYHITANIGASYPRDKGMALIVNSLTDMDGIALGGDGAWDIGAYQYNSGINQPLALKAPMNLKILPQ